MTQLRAGIIGLGAMGRHHARVLTSLDGVDLVGVVDPAGDRYQAARGVRLLPTVDDLVSVGVDYCVVALPTAMHESIGETLAGAGIHALIEKPVAADTASARRLVGYFEQAGLVGAVGHIERYNPALQQMHRRLAAGELGEIYQLVTRRLGPFPERIADVGVVKDLATHDLDLTAWVTGQTYLSVSAHTAHKSGRAHEDLVAIVGRMTNGVITNHLVNWLSPLKERLTIATGERGTLLADTLTADLTFQANGTVGVDWSDVAHFRGMSEGDVIRYSFAKHEPLRTEHEMFRNAVLGGPADIVTLRDGLEAVRVAEAVLTSAVTGTAVQLNHEHAQPVT